MIEALQQAQLIPALVTPFTRQGHSVDEAAFCALVKRLLLEGCSALLVNGTTGEAPTLEVEEKQRLLTLAHNVMAETGRRVPLITGVSGNATQKTLRELVLLEQAHPDAFLLVVPYYNKPTQAGLYEHFRLLAQATPKPIILYNIPGRCVVQLDAPTVVRLHEVCPNIVGIKQSCGDMDRAMNLRAALPSDTFTLWSGDDSLTLPMLGIGARGTISVLAHLAAPSLLALIQQAQYGEWTVAQRMNQALLSLAQELFRLPNPMLVKACLAHRGELLNELRLPLVPTSPADSPLVEALCQAAEAAPRQIEQALATQRSMQSGKPATAWCGTGA